VSLLTGCGTTKTASQKQLASDRWNDARANVLIGLARDQYTNANFTTSRQTIDQALKMAPRNPGARILSGKLYIEGGQLELAERELNQARQLDPTNAEADYLSGIVYQRWLQPERALEFYQHACDKSPAELAYLVAKAEMLVAMERRTEALELLQAKVTYFEHSAVIRDEVGLLLQQQGRINEAVEMFRRASILAPDESGIREHLALALYDQKKFQECADILTALIKEPHYDHRADLLTTLGECQLETNRAGDALDNFTQATELLPGSPGVWLSLARAQFECDEFRQAEVSLKRSLGYDANNSQAYLLLGYLDLRQSRDNEALDAFAHASRLEPTDTVSLCMVGVALGKLGRANQAMECYRQVLKLKPHDEMATQLMARLDSHE
jgi:Tfp pilus assembly protein PilF